MVDGWWLSAGGVGAGGHPDDPDHPQQRDQQEPAALTLQACREEVGSSYWQVYM